MSCSALFLPQAAIEATLVAGVAGRAARLDTEQQGVSIAIVAYFHDALGVARGGAFVPQLRPAAAPEMGLTRGDALFQGQLVHVGQHQHLVRLRVLDDGRHQAPVVPFDLCFQFHWSPPMATI